MTQALRRLLGSSVVLAGLACAPSLAQATQVCAWMTEVTKAADLHDFTLWLQADGEVDLFYKMAGKGVTTESSRMHSPGSGTYVLHKGVAAKPWGFGSTLNPPGDIDFIAELHKKPASIFDDDETPLLASFTFARHVPDGEKKAPVTLATKQCKTLAGG
jgi:hypothetical protein